MADESVEHAQALLEESLTEADDAEVRYNLRTAIQLLDVPQQKREIEDVPSPQHGH